MLQTKSSKGSQSFLRGVCRVQVDEYSHVSTVLPLLPTHISFASHQKSPAFLQHVKWPLLKDSTTYVLHSTSSSSTAVPTVSTTACSLLRSRILPTHAFISTEMTQHHTIFSLPYAESVQVSKSGSLWLPDKYGNVFTAESDSKGTYKDLQKVAYVGPSRPLGHVFDANDNLVICDASKV